MLFSGPFDSIVYSELRVSPKQNTFSNSLLGPNSAKLMAFYSVIRFISKTRHLNFVITMM